METKIVHLTEENLFLIDGALYSMINHYRRLLLNIEIFEAHRNIIERLTALRHTRKIIIDSYY